MSTINKKEEDSDQSKKGKRVNDDNLSSLEEDTIIRHKKHYKNDVTKNQMKDIALGRMSTINKKEEDPDQSKKGKRVNDENLSSLKEDTIIQHKKLCKNDPSKMSNSKVQKTNVIKHNLQMNSANDLFQAEIDRITYAHENTAPINLGYIVFDQTKYNMFFKNNPGYGITKSHLQQFIAMSTEINEIKANIYFSTLVKSKWSPTFNDIKNVFYNWGADLVDTLINWPVLKCQITDDCKNKIELFNFELVINYISCIVLKENNGLSNTELLTLAKFTVIMSLDYYCKQKINILKKLFNNCTRKALNDNKPAIIQFIQELYAKHTKDDLQNIIVSLFLPIGSTVMKNMYSYLTLKLFNSFVGENTDINAFPTDIHIWFVQYLVNKNYFKQNPTHLEGVIRLLEHVVITFDLYQDEENLCNMYAFLYNFVRPIGKSLELVNILDQWRLGLFNLQVDQKKNLY